MAQYRKRKRQRVHLLIDDLEPQSKKMPDKDRDQFQASIIRQLGQVKRKAFHGSIALKIDLSTTSKNPPQAHTIATNILDLLATRRSSVSGSDANLLYRDDSQIQALSVSCRHGQVCPVTSIEGRPLASMLDDLELAVYASREMEMDDPEIWGDEQEKEWPITLKGLLQNETATRERLGDDLYEAYVKMCRWSAQRALLSRSSVDIPTLCWLYDRPKGQLTGPRWPPKIPHLWPLQIPPLDEFAMM